MFVTITSDNYKSYIGRFVLCGLGHGGESIIRELVGFDGKAIVDVPDNIYVGAPRHIKVKKCLSWEGLQQ